MYVLKDKPIYVESCGDILTVLRDMHATLDEIERDREHFYCVHLNTRNKLLGVDVVSVGTVNASIVHPREVFRRAIFTNSVSLIIAHNHPSGDPSPSDADIQITKRLQEVGQLIGIHVIDHIVFSQETYFSFKESNYL